MNEGWGLLVKVQQSQGNIIKNGGLCVSWNLVVPFQAVRKGSWKEFHNHHRKVAATDGMDAYELDYVRMTQLAQTEKRQVKHSNNA